MGPDHRRILLVEDEPEVALATERALARHGFAVASRYDGTEGLREALGGSYDLCLLNVVLPGMGGHDLAGKLQAERPDLPLVFYTAKPEHEVRAQVRAMGIRAAYIRKPFTINGIIAKLGDVLAGRGWL